MRGRSDSMRAAVTLAALLAVAGVAPVARAFPAPHPGLDLAVSGGQSWYPESPLGPSDPFLGKIAAGWSAGGTLEWDLGGPFSLETGLRYALDTELRKAAFRYDPGLEFEFLSRRHLERLGLPVRVRVALPFLRGLSAEGCAETQYLLRARSDDELHGNFGIILGPRPAPGRVAAPAAQIFEPYRPNLDVTGDYARWNLALGGGLGWEFPLGRVNGELRARYQQGVSDQTRTPYAKDFSRVAELGLGVRW